MAVLPHGVCHAEESGENEEVCGYFHDPDSGASENAAGDDFITDHECCQKDRQPGYSGCRIGHITQKFVEVMINRTQEPALLFARLRQRRKKENPGHPGASEKMTKGNYFCAAWLAFRQSSTSFLPEVDLILRNDIDLHALFFQFLDALLIFCLGFLADFILDFLGNVGDDLLLIRAQFLPGVRIDGNEVFDIGAVGDCHVLGNFINLAGQDCRLSGGLAVDRAVLDTHVFFRGAHGRRGCTEGFQHVSGNFGIGTHLQSLEIFRFFQRPYIIRELDVTIVSPDQRAYALLFQLFGECFAQVSVQSVIDCLVRCEDERKIQNLHSRDNHGPACRRIHADIEAAAHQCVIHVLIIVKLACRVDFDVNGTFGTFIDLLGELFDALGQMMIGRKLVSQFQFHFLSGCAARFLVSTRRHAAPGHQASQNQGC